ncbi:flagellar biosynthesis protein FlhF [Marinobacterium nitratireducens]|uniref:Flagellar biosynthesis protein FlhF n=1 Tax=Marinobacterium nitratireducens TaxID=518897 RepID=A0A917ZK55_9GAMM|nr:flagellar biosynthesis protein FlhF [Marinobacterium nitratireducens]GGO85022.1 flagellar biosynthesis protein FlhF [Marinobacterium nitratireducens]
MKVKRIFAPDMRQAMRRVREEIGPDAVIVSNHRVAGGVEVVAAHEHEYEAAQAEFKRQGQERRRREEQLQRQHSAGRQGAGLDDEMRKVRARIAAAQQQAASPAEPGLDVVRNRQIESDEDDEMRSILETLKARQQARIAVPADVPEPAPRRPAPESADGGDHRMIVTMQQEIQQLRAMLESQLKSPPPAAPAPRSQPPVAQAKLSRRLDSLGIGARVVRHLVADIEQDIELDKAWRGSLARLSDAIPVVGEEFIERGGMVAFVGPTGVGKTTTIGKLAARYVLRYGSSSLALVTTDSYRIAAHEQLRTFGRILDVPVRVADENHSLEEVLQSLRGKRLVLIDTAGMSASEPHTGEQIELLKSVPLRMKKLLVLSCSSQRRVLESAYDTYRGLGLNGCVLSKLDESGSLGEALTLAIEKQLPIAYVTDGQKIPDDIGVARRHDLVSRAVVTAQKALEREQQSGDEPDLAFIGRTG